MSTGSVPRWVRRVLRRILPREYADDFGDSLSWVAAERFGAGRRSLAVHLWYAVQLARPSTWLLAFKLRGGAPQVRVGAQRQSRLSAWFGDAGEAARGLTRAPGFAAAVITSVAIGVGATVAAFAVLNAVLLSPPPYPDSDRLVFLWNKLDGYPGSRLPMSSLQVAELREERTVFEDVGGVWATSRTMSLGDRAALVPAGIVTPNFFSVLGVSPALGRDFGEDEGLETLTALISQALWREEFGADSAVVGRTIQLEGEEAVIVGVLPAVPLVFPPGAGIPERLDVFTPTPWAFAVPPSGPRFLRTVARLNPDVGVASADAWVGTVSSRLREVYPGMASAGDQFSAVGLHSDAVERVRPGLLALMGTVLMFLLLTAANVASLVLARSARRINELSIRRWLGASLGRLMRLVLVEVGLLTTIGALVGLGAGVVAARGLWALRPSNLIRVGTLEFEPTVIAVAAAGALVAGILASIPAIWRLLRSEDQHAFRTEGSGRGTSRRRARRWITSGEFAVCVVLVSGASLMAKTMDQLRSADLGFVPRQTLTFRMGLSQSVFTDEEERTRLAQRVEDEIGLLPGVVAAGASSHLPLGEWANWSGIAAPVEVPEDERDGYFFDHRSVTPGYVEALGIDVIQGRALTQADVGTSETVVLIDEALAEAFFGSNEAIGRTIVATRYLDGDFRPTEATVVGVVGRVRDQGPQVAGSGQVFWPFAQSPRWELGYAVRTEADPNLLVDQLRGLIPSIHADLAPADFRLMDDYVAAALADSRFASRLSAAFAVIALLMAALGIYGVIGYSVEARQRELGMRVAVGARSSDLFRLVVRDGLMIGLVGVVFGLLGTFALSRYLQALLFEVSAFDPLVLGGVVAFLLAMAVTASIGPALRATRLDPVESIRGE